jgi:pimeloyl-ACP methyl ester carboxylesterase
MPPAEVFFDVGGLRLAARCWGEPTGFPVLALHGWLDNAASFDFVAPLMGGCYLVCLDLAGHGKSQYRGYLGAYNIWQDVAEIFWVADQLGWDRFALLGHSRGAMIAFLAAGTLPQRVSHLSLIEGGPPRTATADRAPELLAESLRTVRLALARQRQYYPNFSDAVAARMQGMFPLVRQDAEALARQGVGSASDGFYWSYDPRLIAGSEVRLSAEQVEAFRSRVTARTQVVLADDGLLVKEAAALDWLAASPQWKQLWLPGDHHLHMHAQCSPVAIAINAHFRSTS